MPVYASYSEALPRESFILLSGLVRRLKLPALITAKLDFWGPTGHMYDRIAPEMLDATIESGELDKGDTIIETAHGAFATSLCIAAARRGIRVVLCVPDNMPASRMKMLTALGAKMQTVNAAEGIAGLLQRANALQKSGAGLHLNYLSNDKNPETHRLTTGPEIRSTMGDTVDFFVCGINSAGTITGTGEYLKSWGDPKIIAVEPFENQVITGGFAGKHNIADMGLPFVPPNYNPYIVDGVMTASTGDAVAMADTVFYTDGIPVATAGGAALAAAVELARKHENEGKQILTIFPSKRNF